MSSWNYLVWSVFPQCPRMPFQWSSGYKNCNKKYIYRVWKLAFALSLTNWHQIMELIRLSKMNLYYRFATQHEIHIFSLSSGVDFYSPTPSEIENVFSLELKDKNRNLRNHNLWKEEFSIIQEKRPFSRLITKGQLCVLLSSSKVLNLSSHVPPTKTLCVWRSFINPHQHVCMWEIYYVHFCLLGCVWMNISVNIQTFTRQAAAPIKKKVTFVLIALSSLWIPIFLFGYKWWIVGCLLLRPFRFARPEMQLSDGEDADEHGLHSAVIQRGGGEPQRAVGDAAALRVKVEQVGALLDRLWAGWKTIVNCLRMGNQCVALILVSLWYLVGQDYTKLIWGFSHLTWTNQECTLQSSGHFYYEIPSSFF